MPIYPYSCECGCEVEKLQTSIEDTYCPECGAKMRKLPTFPSMVKITGAGGYPSRRKQTAGTAPYTTRDVKPWGESDPSKPNWLSQDARRREEARTERVKLKKRQVTVEEAKALMT